MKILYVDDEPSNLLTFRVSFRKWFEIVVSSNPLEALKLAEDPEVMVCITDQRMPEMTGLELAEAIMKIRPEIPIIILTGYADQDVMMEAINLGGIFRYVMKPWSLEELKQTIINAGETCQLRKVNINLVETLTKQNNDLNKAYNEIVVLQKALQEENVMLKEDLSQLSVHDLIVGKSKAITRVLKEITRAARSDAPVLLLGETGTGKELFARMVHRLSKRKEQVMVSLNCSAIPESLIESELFGYEKGAFSGALNRKYGKFEVANGGTLFFDEVGELPLNLQSKLLRVLQEMEFERLGGNDIVKTDVRIISATNRNIDKAMADGSFRNDLFYRINVLPIVIPPLRERMEDIPLLVNHFVTQLNRKTGKVIESVPKETLDRFMKYHWPGNVRELSNIVERAHVLSDGSKLMVGDWFQNTVCEEDGWVVKSLEEMERDHILRILKKTQWKIRGINGAADFLGINPSTLDSKIRKLGIKRPH
ncbi:MAG: sigma-54-dependent Fis family transcriptional regulator [Bacteroidales bacterium]|nr:sigma-54-dependent Fis family transcriptional regulator [Bacteroidales bacterium]